MTTDFDPVAFVRASDLVTIDAKLHPDAPASAAQRMVLRCIDGTDFSDDEEHEYRTAINHGEEPGLVSRVVDGIKSVVGVGTSRNRHPMRVLLQKGRQSGVTQRTIVAHGLKVVLADWTPLVGEQTTRYVYIAPVLDQARSFLNATFNALRKLNIRCVKRDHEIELPDQRVIIFADVPNALSGRSWVTVGTAIDEAFLLPTDPEAVGNQREVLSSITPGMVTVIKSCPVAGILICGSPWRSEGAYFELVEKALRGESTTDIALVLPTFRMNPRVSYEDTLAMADDASTWRREYRGLTDDDDDESAFKRADVEACVDRGRAETVPSRNCEYRFTVDASGLTGNDDWALTGGYRIVREALDGQPDDLYMVVFAQTWNDRDWKKVIRENSGVLKAYGVERVVGDQYAAAMNRAEFSMVGVTLEDAPMNPSRQNERYRLLQAKIATHTIRLPDNPKLIQQLCDLRVKKLDSGKFKYEAPRGKKDDLADCLALLVEQLSQTPPSGESTIISRPATHGSLAMGSFEVRQEWGKYTRDVITGESTWQPTTPPIGSPERLELAIDCIARGVIPIWLKEQEIEEAKRARAKMQMGARERTGQAAKKNPDREQREHDGRASRTRGTEARRRLPRGPHRLR